ncbi:MAG: SulP family inorganic anion transporter [Dehalococcoidia bacterium]|nr:SulP family inorganic anion transporter [Dehalococcoidia bacterium]
MGSGLVVGVVAFPLCIALAVAAGVPPIVGLYTAVFAGSIASAAGGSRFNITGPTAALVPLLLHLAVTEGVEALALAAMIAGVILLAMGLLRFGRAIRYMPRLVIVGFTAGIAVSIAAGQLNNLLGLTGTDPQLEYFHEKMADSVRHLGSIEPASLAIGLGSILFMGIYQARPRQIPGALLVVVGATIVAQAFDLDAATVSQKYGDLPRSLPRPTLAFFDFTRAIHLLPSAAAIAVLGAVESLLSAVVADGMVGDGERHNPDRELVGQGLANIVAPIMGGIPATAAIARTATGIRSGATSRLSGIIHSVVVLLLVVALAPLAGDIPLAALAAILIIVAWGIADVPELVKLVKTAPRTELLTLGGTMLVTVVLDLTFAIALGVMVSLVLLLRELIRIPVAAQVLGDGGDPEDIPPTISEAARAHPEVLFFNASGIISFHSAAAFESTLPRHDPRTLILRMRDIRHIDSSGLITLQGVIEHRRGSGGETILTDVRPEVARSLKRFGIAQLVLDPELDQTTEQAFRSLQRAADTQAEGEQQHATDWGGPFDRPATATDLGQV